MDFHEQIGRGRIEARVRELAVYTRLRLQSLPLKLLTPSRPGLWAGILTFRVPGRSAVDMATTLARNNRVHVRALRWPQVPEGALRVALHIFNSPDDAERLAQAMQQFAGQR
jgi:isopenicillin-N epimerase